jgi:hypothetical protein
MIRYVMTEAANVTRFLSFGCLGPSVVHGDRYRHDISADFKGAMVLLEDPSQAVGAVLSTKDAIPVAIEVDDVFGGDDAMVVTGSLVPIVSVRRLHFRTKKEMTEFRSIGYQNVDPAAVDCEVTPGLFEPPGEGSDASGTAGEAGQPSLDIDAPAPAAGTLTEIVPAERIERLDRITGALSAVLAPGLPTRAMVEHTANTIVAAVSALEPVEEVFVQGFVPAAERDLHVAISESLISLPHTETGHERLLADIVARHESAGPQLRALDEMLRAKRDLDREAIEGVCARALLVALAHPSPEDVAVATGDGAPADQERPIAQWYAGLRRGGSRRPVTTRMSMIEPLIQRWLAAQGAAGRPPRLPDAPKRIDVDARVGTDSFEYRYVIDGEPSSPILRPFPSDRARVARAVREHWRTAVLVADSIGVTVTTTIHLEGPAPIHLEASPFIIRVDVPHRLDRKVDPEQVIQALQHLDTDQLHDLAHRYAATPAEAP